MKKPFLPLMMGIAMLLANPTARAQCPYPVESCECPKIAMPPFPSACPGVPYVHDFTPDITIPSDVTVTGWTWTPTAGVSPASGSGIPGTTTFTPPSTTTYFLTLTGYGINLINNGDFSSWPGSPCFNTAHTLYTGTFLHGTPNTYVVDVNPSPYVAGVSSFADHTSTLTGPPPGPYNMLISHSTPGMLVWGEKEIPVCPDMDYEFSFWMANVVSMGASTNPQLRVVIDGVPYSPYSAPGVGIWTQHTIPYHSSPSGGTISIEIFDDQTYVKSNGSALDDISFRRVCKVTEPFKILVNKITGTSTICAGNTTTLSVPVPGGTWTSLNTSIATVDASGVVTGVPGASGTVTIQYTDPSGCTATITIHVLPNPVSITGPSSICSGSTAVLTGAPGGLTWSHTGPVTTPSAGVYVGSSSGGPAIITYTDPSTGCYATHNLMVNQMPYALPPSYLCMGTTTSLMTTPPGGTWTSSSPGVATIGLTSGLLTTLSPGVTIITYVTAGGCSMSTAVNVYDCSTPVVVALFDQLCEGHSNTLIGLPAGGTWTSSAPGVATIDPVTGVVYAVPGGGGGSVTFTYTSGGMTTTVVINILGPETACVTFSGMDFVFTTSCTSTASVHFYLYDWTGTLVGYPSGYWTTVTGGISTMSYSSVTSLPYGAYTPPTGTTRLCVDYVVCNGCGWPVSCCANVNPPKPGRDLTGIANEGSETQLAIIPNPSNGTFVVSGALAASSDEATVSIDVIDVTGRTVYNAIAGIENGGISKNVSLPANIANGTYMVKVHNQNNRQVMRVSIER